MKVTYPREWRTQNRILRRVYAKYMTWLERLGYLVVVLVIGGFIYAFNYKVDETVSADKVKLELASQPILLDDTVTVMQVLVPDQAEVKKGQHLFSYFGSGMSGRPLAYSAPRDGIFTYDPKVVGSPVAGGIAIGRILDPMTVVFRASLAGPSVASADSSDAVSVTGFTVEPNAGVTYRQATSTGTQVSSQVFDEELKRAASEAIRGYDLVLRDDRPFSTSEVTDLTIESTSGQAVAKMATDPDSKLVCQAQITSSGDKAVAQIADLPPDVADKLRAAVKAAMLKRGHTAPDDLRFVLKVKASPETDTVKSVRATALTRTFDIQGKLVDPPESLLQAVRQAQKAGKSVTAKVELKTGSRPLATILLKKS